MVKVGIKLRRLLVGTVKHLTRGVVLALI